MMPQQAADRDQKAFGRKFNGLLGCDWKWVREEKIFSE